MLAVIESPRLVRWNLKASAWYCGLSQRRQIYSGFSARAPSRLFPKTAQCRDEINTESRLVLTLRKRVEVRMEVEYT
ncbi:uncharacterized [Tachysurus ichikawai]